MSSTVHVTVTGRTRASAERTFDVIPPIELPSIFRRFLLIPAIRGVEGQDGAWDAAGQSRTILLGDGTSVREQLTRVERPTRFAYVVGPFPPPLGLIAEQAEGEWTFAPAQGGGTDITWTYAFFPRPGRHALTRLAIAPMWRGYAQRTLARAVAAADAAA